ncbi:MAG: lipase family protein [Methylococcaceae bacterium]
MKIISFVLFLLSAMQLLGCSSVGSQTLAKDACPEKFNSATALELGKIAGYAYQKDRNKLKEGLATSGYTLDDYDLTDSKTGTDGFIAHNVDSVVVAFTGSEEIKDWLRDVQTWSDKVLADESCHKDIAIHSGFEDAIHAVTRNGKLMERINNYHQQGKKIYVTGHSLGGAMATLFAYYAEARAPMFPVEAVYTFGQPLVGDENFQGCYDARLKEKTYRYVNDRDFIPKVRAERDFRHVGVFLFFDQEGDLSLEKPESFVDKFTDLFKENPIDGHVMGSYLEKLEKNKNINPFACS